MLSFAFHLVWLNCVVVAVINNIGRFAGKPVKRTKQNRRYYPLYYAKTQGLINFADRQKIDFPSNYAAV